MGLLPLFCVVALTGCGEKPVKLDNVSLPAEAVQCGDFPKPPSGPLNCKGPSGEDAMCQSEVAVWVETEVFPAYNMCKNSADALKIINHVNK